MTWGILRRRRFAVCVALLCAAAGSAGGAAAPDDPLAVPRTQFQQAYGRLADPSVDESTDSAGLRGYVLYPYLQAARLAQTLRTTGASVPEALDERVAAFIRAHDGQPVTQELRRSWLAGLAERSQWARFLAFHRPESDEPALRCHGFTARIELQRTQGLEDEIARAWQTPGSLPECERAFERLRGAGLLDAARVEQRVRLALESNNPAFARQLAQQLPSERSTPLLLWAALLENPRREIDTLIAAPQKVVDTPTLLAGWTRLARTDRAAAKQRFAPLVQARGLDPRAASPFALALALALSWDRDAEALGYFARVDAADFDDLAREWQARAALWAGDWQQVPASIAAMGEANRATSRWRYWSARAAAHAGNESEARAAYESILPDDNYYSAMAAARLKRKVAPHPQRLPVDETQLGRVEAEPPFVRARELRSSGLIRDALNEWRFGQQSLQATALPQAVHLAARWGWFDQAITTATAARVFNDYALLYPRPYDKEVAHAAKLTGLSPEVIYGVLRQESLYRNDAVSTASAHGLMQLQIDTARRTARAWKQPVPSEITLSDPAVNVTLGAAHVKELLDRFGGQLSIALAGYNAGPNAASRWLPAAPVDPDIWIENIPYNETRAYVQRIFWHRVVFSWLRKGEAQDTRGWLVPLRP
jgi:soluble lytic murein transglycosylase